MKDHTCTEREQTRDTNSLSMLPAIMALVEYTRETEITQHYKDTLITLLHNN